MFARIASFLAFSGVAGAVGTYTAGPASVRTWIDEKILQRPVEYVNASPPGSYQGNANPLLNPVEMPSDPYDPQGSGTPGSKPGSDHSPITAVPGNGPTGSNTPTYSPHHRVGDRTVDGHVRREHEWREHERREHEWRERERREHERLERERHELSK